MPDLKRRTDDKPRRDDFRHIYQSSRWHRYSKAFLKQNRLCVYCLQEGRTEVARCVDHIVAMTAGGSIWDRSNHQPLCFKCHNKKTKEENSR